MTAIFSNKLRPIWPRLRHTGVATLAALALLGGLIGAPAALAQPARPAHDKLAPDLTDAVQSSPANKPRWVRDVNGVRHVQAVVMSHSADPEMSDLRAFVLRSGGSVLVRHSGIRALTVLMNAGTLNALAQRSDVISVSPNRDTYRTASTLEAMTGALAGAARTASTKTSYSGLDGSGIGIAVLDSGVMKAHAGFYDANRLTRVKRNVNPMNGANTATAWITGVDGLAGASSSISKTGCSSRPPHSAAGPAPAAA